MDRNAGGRFIKKHRVNVGRPVSSETRRKISEAGKGKPSNHLGKHHSKEVKKKISKARKGQIPWNKSKKGLYKMSEETKRKISGKNNHNWKGGISSENEKIRSSIEIRLWKESTFARDSWTCQKCGDNSGGNLNSHHIKNFAEYPELRFAIDNGITFCKSCHQEFHKIYGKKYNTKEQLLEFLRKAENDQEL